MTSNTQSLAPPLTTRPSFKGSQVVSRTLAEVLTIFILAV